MLHRINLNASAEPILVQPVIKGRQAHPIYLRTAC